MLSGWPQRAADDGSFEMPSRLVATLLVDDMFEIDRFEVDDPTDFDFIVTTFVGHEGFPGFYTFWINIVTPKWISRECASKGACLGESTFIVSRYNGKDTERQVQNQLISCLSQCQGSTSDEVDEQIEQIGNREYKFCPWDQRGEPVPRQEDITSSVRLLHFAPVNTLSPVVARQIETPIAIRASFQSTDHDEQAEYEFRVCTPEWLAEECKRTPVIVGHGLIVMAKYDEEILTRELRGICASAKGRNWTEVKRMIGWFGKRRTG